jgi:hypothetical protein
VSATLPIIVADIERASGKVVRVTLDHFKGHDLIDVRTWYRAENGNLRPSKAGFALVVHRLPELADALNLAVVRARAAGLLGDGDAGR